MRQLPINILKKVIFLLTRKSRVEHASPTYQSPIILQNRSIVIHIYINFITNFPRKQKQLKVRLFRKRNN